MVSFQESCNQLVLKRTVPGDLWLVAYSMYLSFRLAQVLSLVVEYYVSIILMCTTLIISGKGK